MSPRNHRQAPVNRLSGWLERHYDGPLPVAARAAASAGGWHRAGEARAARQSAGIDRLARETLRGICLCRLAASPGAGRRRQVLQERLAGLRHRAVDRLARDPAGS